MSWGDDLTKLIASSEKRFIEYKKLLGESFKKNDDEMKAIFKELKQDEEKWHKFLVKEKTAWNAGMWLVQEGK